MAKPSHGVAKGWLCQSEWYSRSIGTPESVRLHAVIDIYADMRVLHEKGGGANRGYIMSETRE